MSTYELADYSDRSESLIKLCEYPQVTLDNIVEIKEIISYIQLPLYQVQEGDNLTIYIIDNRVDEIKGFLAIWRNKGVACLNTGSKTVWGNWEEAEKTFMTEDFEAGLDVKGDPITGRIAYNAHGIRGIYTQGSFYRLHGSDSNLHLIPPESPVNQIEQAI